VRVSMTDDAEKVQYLNNRGSACCCLNLHDHHNRGRFVFILERDNWVTYKERWLRSTYRYSRIGNNGNGHKIIISNGLTNCGFYNAHFITICLLNVKTILLSLMKL